MKYLLTFLFFTKVIFGISDSVFVITKEVYKCTEDTSVYVKISYPQIIVPHNKNVQNKINSFLESEFLKAIQTYEEFIADSESLEDYPADWVFNFEVSFKTEYLSNNFASILMDYYEYTGGAHGNYFSTGYNIKLSDGELLKLTDIIKENELSNLSLFCEQEILEKFNENTLADVGLFEDEINITPEQDFYIKPGYLVIQFDPYEIGPYAMGSIEIELRFDRIKNLFKPNLPFKI